MAIYHYFLGVSTPSHAALRPEKKKKFFQNSLTRNLILHAAHLGKMKSEIKTIAGVVPEAVMQLSTMENHPVGDKVFYYSS